MKGKLRFYQIVLTVVSLFALDGCLAAVAGVGAETAYVATQENRSTGEILSDQRITAEIKTRLLADQSVSGMDINVDTFKGEVTLRGVLRNNAQADQALKIAKATSGVKGVKSALYVE